MHTCDGSHIDAVLQRMMQDYLASQSEVQASKYWVELNSKNVKQLYDIGYESFKQTVALNYFTCLVGLRDPQVKFLVRNLPVSSVLSAFGRALLSKGHSHFTAKQSLFYNFVTFMVWEYTARQRARDILACLEEPLDGNPPSVRLSGKEISQDLAYSVLEFRAISDGVGDLDSISTVMELGAGYGRTAYVFLQLMPHLRYVIVDIPPALYISQRYISGQFPDRKLFKFRSFGNYSEIADEFCESQIAFLLPGQLDLLPDNTVDLFLAIDSLHEMRPEQIEYYFSTIGRLTRAFFYFKCWKNTKIPYDNITLTEGDYPVRDRWSKVFWRDCKLLTFPTWWDGKWVQSTYFEALFSLVGLDESSAFTGTKRGA